MRLLVILLLLSGCSTPEQKPLPPLEGIPVYKSEVSERIVYVTAPLELPNKPDIPKIRGKDLICLTPTVQWELKNRDTILKDYISELETIIKSTQK